jgi:hypothetical protein
MLIHRRNNGGQCDATNEVADRGAARPKTNESGSQERVVTLLFHPSSSLTIAELRQSGSWTRIAATESVS